jgi:hypothetical protein
MTRARKSKKAHLTKAQEPPRKLVPVDADLYSKQSKRSEGWYMLPTHYQPISYICRACGRTAVWSPEEQKHDLEQRGLYMWAGRILCRACFRRKMTLKKTLRQRQLIHAKVGQCAPLTRAIIQQWLKELDEYRDLGGNANLAIQNMLQNKLRAIEAASGK